MGTNFDFLETKEQYSDFAESAIEAEKSLLVSPATCAILSRRALELSVKWVYANDDDLTVPYRNNISSLIHQSSFKDIIDMGLFPLLKYIIKLGNTAVHTNKEIDWDEAVLSLRNLHEFIRWIDYCYSEKYNVKDFDESLLEKSRERRKRPEELQELYERLSAKDKKLEQMRSENEKLRKSMTANRVRASENYKFKVDSISEEQTRKKYIDVELKFAGWILGRDYIEEVGVEGMETPSGLAFVDYVLYGDNGKPLALVEAKKASVNPVGGLQQAKLYADCLEERYGQRPLIFITNGFEILFIDDKRGYPKRQVAGIFTKDQMQLIVNRRKNKKPLKNIDINSSIANRYYQREAATAVCEAIEKRKRKMLLVMAPGSGKTRTAISIVDILKGHGYIKNILFLADRKVLVQQAKSNFKNLLPNLPLCNLLDEIDNPEEACIIFSTYPEMMNAIDETKNESGKRLFTPGYFDLIIIDESHSSIYKKYKDIFNYFDALLLGFTSTPKDEIDKNTYKIFELEKGITTFVYDLEKAVEDGYLVPYSTIEVKPKIMADGILYNDLSDKEKEEFENTFEDDEIIDDSLSSNDIDQWLFNESTIDMVLNRLMDKGLKVEAGEKLGKTIIFAKNSFHAKAIVDRFHKIYPDFEEDFIKQIDYSINHVDSLMEYFATRDKFPQIAVSVDMLDTGIDIHEILNLVFFKKVRSKSKFWQMIGRGTRPCKDLLGVGIDKEEFLIFDFCNNFEFFRVEKNTGGLGIQKSLSEKIYNLKVNIVRELQDTQYEKDKYIKYRESLVKDLRDKVLSLNEESFRVKLHLRYVDTYKNKDEWEHLDVKKVSEIKEHISPLIPPIEDDELAKRFDYLIYTVNLALLQNNNAKKPIRSIVKTAKELSKLYNIPKVKEQKHIIEKVQKEEFWENVNVIELEKVREALRDLIRLIK
ncbi:DEAD/DEAH box helicase family protein [Herbivorax sp. ANBcel31]|uniref:DEAD/DEAH box helicase family protein n=1 Tax=Herbivorax sp. ANBcel31 TaxID=3069754 RepID=UPI0027AEB9CB|nr:DEAD/DEAH box helicase family protein [Herbivorax sp. ANBcel31]MDQ2084943.1 DEAD/DEAH box helicase family protein [Herbivorax sp. ANBcel31]